MLQINGDGVVPRLRGNFFDEVARVVGGVVDENINRSIAGEDGFDGTLQLAGVREIAWQIERRCWRRRREPCSELLSSRSIEVEENDA